MGPEIWTPLLAAPAVGVLSDAITAGAPNWMEGVGFDADAADVKAESGRLSVGMSSVLVLLKLSASSANTAARHCWRGDPLVNTDLRLSLASTVARCLGVATAAS